MPVCATSSATDFWNPATPVLGGDIGRFIRAGRLGMRRCRGDQPPPALGFHMRQDQPRGVEYARQVERDDQVPFGDGKFIDRRDMLRAGIVDQDIDPAELVGGVSDHALDRRGIGQVGVAVSRPRARSLGQLGPLLLDRRRLAKAVDHDIGPGPCQGGRIGRADTRGRPGDQRGLAGEEAVAHRAAQSPIAAA